MSEDELDMVIALNNIEADKREAQFDLAPAIEAIAEKVHKGWMQENTKEGDSFPLPADIVEQAMSYHRKTVGTVFQWLEENGWKVVRK